MPLSIVVIVAPLHHHPTSWTPINANVQWCRKQNNKSYLRWCVVCISFVICHLCIISVRNLILIVNVINPSCILNCLLGFFYVKTLCWQTIIVFSFASQCRKTPVAYLIYWFEYPFSRSFFSQKFTLLKTFVTCKQKNRFSTKIFMWWRNKPMSNCIAIRSIAKKYKKIEPRTCSFFCLNTKICDNNIDKKKDNFREKWEIYAHSYILKKKNRFRACKSSHYLSLFFSRSLSHPYAHIFSFSHNFILLICIRNELWFVMVKNVCTSERCGWICIQINKIIYKFMHLCVCV